MPYGCAASCPEPVVQDDSATKLRKLMRRSCGAEETKILNGAISKGHAGLTATMLRETDIDDDDWRSECPKLPFAGRWNLHF
jgi:hypothetical protein